MSPAPELIQILPDFHLPLLLLVVLAFVAGFIDSVVGGGGLIQLPAYFVCFPSMPMPVALGSNKMAALMGTLVSTWRYLRTSRVIWKAVVPAFISCLVFSFAGARLVAYLNTDMLRMTIFILLIAVLAYTYLKKNMGLHHNPRLSGFSVILYSILTGTVLGFYDGFFGPGTGSFLILAYVTIFGFDFLNASVSAKIINCGTNLAALAYFIYGGYVDYSIAIPAGISNMAGSYLGANMALKKGSGFVRVLFLVIVSGLIMKFGYDIFK